MKTLLFVDDEPKVLRGLQRQLQPMSNEWNMHFAESGQKALDFMAAQPVDIVVSDMMMPGMDGPALIAALRALDPAVRFVGVTGMSDVESMRGYGSLALSGMLAKPFTIETLLTAVQAALPVAAGKKGSVPAGGKSGSAPPGEI